MFNQWMNRYGWIALGLLLPLIGAAMQSLYWKQYPVAPFLLFIPAIFFSAQLGGRRSGMLAVLVSIFLSKYFFLEPVHTLRPQNPGQALMLLFGVIISLIIVQFHHNLQSRTLQLKEEQERTRAALRQVEQREAELRDLNTGLERKVAERTSELVANQADMERIRANLAASEAKFRAIFEQSPLGLALGDAATASLIAVNKRFLEITGRSHEEYLQHHWAEYTHPDDLPAELVLLERLQKGEISGYEVEKRYFRPDGSSVWIHLSISPVLIDKVRGRWDLAIVEDITGRKRAEFETIQLTAELRQTNATRDKLFSIIAHDLRGSIGGLQQGLELVTGRSMLDEARKAMLLEELKKSSRLAFSLVENLLNWARSQTNSISIEPQIFNLAEPAGEVLETMRPMANQKKIALEWEGGAAVTVLADRSSIEVVLRNLLSNAIKFTPERGRVSLSAVENDGCVEVTVADSGVGMSRVILARLFQPDSYYSTYGTAREKGSGIGLMLCKDFIERNGGLLRAESEEGRGSRFIFTLPRG